MSFIDSPFYEETLVLLDKNEETPTPITEGQVINGDLTPFRHKMEATNTGNQKQNSGTIILRIPPDGTFRTKEPILVDESAQDDYIIQFQMKQDRDKDGIFEEEGKLFSFFIGQPTLRDDENAGETLQITLIPIEYRTRETLDAQRLFLGLPNDKRDPFVSSAGAFSQRLFNYNLIKGTDNTQLIPDFVPFKQGGLPDAPLLEWRPLAPTATHDLFKIITDRQALAGVQGGVFTDFFFDYEANPLSTKTVSVRVEAEGTTNRGVVLDPLIFETSETTKENTINVDLIKFKNNVIAQGSPTGGSLPRELTVFSSLFEHGKIRPIYDDGDEYFSGGVGSGSTNQSEIRITDEVLGHIRFFKAIDDSGPLSGGAVNPLDAVNRTAKWEEDFVTIPPYNNFASYNQDDVVTQLDPPPNDSIVRFYKCINVDGVPNNPQDESQFKPVPLSSTIFWVDTDRSFTDGFEHPLFNGASPEGLARAGRTKFFSYTPWTADFEAMRQSSLFGVEDEDQVKNFVKAGYQGLIPDWNYVRAVYDRVESDNRFEVPMGKDVQKKIQSLSDIKEGERHFGNRWYIGNVASGDLIGHQNEVLEWVGADFKVFGGASLTDLRFSRKPNEGDTIIDRSRGVWLVFDPSVGWKDMWNIVDVIKGAVENDLKRRQALSRGGNYTPATSNVLQNVKLQYDREEFGSTGLHSPLHIVRDIKLVEGATGVPGQAIEYRYDWSSVESILGIPVEGADRMNFTSLGAWWFMMFPYPKIQFTEFNPPSLQREIGDVYKRPYVDTNNLDFNHEGKEGWNLGLDSEDLGRIQRVSFKARLSLFGSIVNELVIGYADMPMKFWAVDIFDRVWYADFTLRRNGQYSLVQLSFGENSIQQLHRARYDELLNILGIVFDVRFQLQEVEWTGIEFDWRFVKSVGMFYDLGYNSEGLYVANQFIDFAYNIAEQAVGQALGFITAGFATLTGTAQDYNPKDFLVNNARLAVDEFHFQKQAYANSDRAPVPKARTVLDHLAQEQDYVNLQLRAVATQGRRKFVEQAWFMQAHGDVRLRFGEKFVATGPRVPNGSQDLVVKEVKHIIDSDGYMMQIIGKRKFEFGG